MAIQKFRITVEHPYGPLETYVILAKDVKTARKMAKERYAKDYFSKRNMKTYVQG